MPKKKPGAPTAYGKYLEAKSRLIGAVKAVETQEGFVVTSTPPSLNERRRATASMQVAMYEALKSDEPLPCEMKAHLAHVFEVICSGIADDLVIPVGGPGRPEHPIKKELRACAIRYIRWVEEGRITDPLPVNTVAAYFDVGEKTVRKWVKDWVGRPTPALFEDFGADVVKAAMKGAGARYQA